MTLLQAALDYYGSLPTWAQLAIQWLIRAAVASFILAQWSSVATNWYAMRYGARPPVEGVPFLALTVAVLGLMLLVWTVLLFQAIPTILRLLRHITTVYIKDDLSDRILKYVAYSFVFLFSLAIPLIAIKLLKTKAAVYLFTALIVLPVFSLTWLSIRDLKDKEINRLSLGLYTVFIALLMVAMLGKPFDHILRATKFGGGVKVDVDLRDNSSLTGQSLFLTSANFVTIYDPGAAKFRELNRDHIIQIEYSGISGWSLPREKEYAEIFGFDDLGTTTTATPMETKPHRRP
jgi:hypothetical protein